MAENEVIDVRDEILAYLKEIKRPLAWITKPNTSIPYGSAYSILEQKVMELSKERLDEINQYLNTNFSLQEKNS